MAKEENKKVKNDKKENKNFFKNLKAELKKVIWPTPKQLVNNTVAVITIVIITAIIVMILDFAFDFGAKFGIDKIRATVGNNTTNVIETTVDENQENAENANNTESEVQNEVEGNNEATTNAETTENSVEVNNTQETTTQNVAQ